MNVVANLNNKIERYNKKMSKTDPKHMKVKRPRLEDILRETCKDRLNLTGMPPLSTTWLNNSVENSGLSRENSNNREFRMTYE